MSEPAPRGEELTLDVPGLRLAGLAWGPPDGRRVLALHGWLDNAASFAELARHLPDVRLVALDLPGHGRSQHRPASAPYDFVEWVVDVAAAVHALGWTRFALVGHSMGGAIAALFAGTLPESVERLVLIEGIGPSAVPAAEAPERLQRSIEQARVAVRPRRVHETRGAAEERLREVGLSELAARTLAERGTVETVGGVQWSSDARLRGLSPFRITEEHVRAFLMRIACPTLFLRAKDGFPFDADALAARFGLVREGRRVDVDGGHHVHIDRADEVARLVGPFLRGAAAPAAPDGGGPARDDGRPEMGVRLVVLDVDGVLTDGGLVYDADGRELKRFDVRDGMAVKLLRQAGLEVALLSARPSAAVEQRARELGLEHVILGADDKRAALDALLVRLALAPAQAAYMGDDLVDLAPMRVVGFPSAPADARPEVRRAARLVTRAAGGHGAVRELAEHLLRAQDRWTALVARLGGSVS